MQARHALIMTLMVVALGACHRDPADAVPDELKAIQGEWFFDEARFLEEQERTAKSKEESQKVRKLYDQLKANGTPVKSDIIVRGTRIIGKGPVLQEQFDIFEYRRTGEKLICKALWHEDRHDPGDASEVKLVLQVSDNVLKLWLDPDEDENPFFFKRRK